MIFTQYVSPSRRGPVGAEWVPCYGRAGFQATVYARWWAAPVVKLAHWWRMHRWCLEEWSAHRDRSLLAEGGYYRDHYWHTGERYR